ncbi:MAG: DUF1385 domain-containing protein [Caldilineaceae bacterium]|nr:DUF1385 domain-containing protein [Caldilineaceae bacterium]
MSQQYYGGQAIIEGVLMRGASTFAVAVRTASGEIRLHHEPLKAWIYTSRLGKLPFVRGLGLLWEALGLGVRAIMWSADIAAQDMPLDDDDGDPEGEAEDRETLRFQGPLAWGTVALSFAFGIGLFFLLPTLVSGWVAEFFGASAYVDAAIEGAVRLVLFALYFFAISFMKDIRRMFGFHGAEHKAINAFEAGSNLSVPDVQRHSVQHVRCGTSFILFVVVISIILFFPLSFHGVEPAWLALLLRFASRLLLLPIVAGIAYELIRFSARHQENPLLRVFIQPGLWLQKATTRTPDDEMVRTAVAALIPVLESDGVEVDPATRALLSDRVVLSSMTS